jgi:hypothetical protein
VVLLFVVTSRVLSPQFMIWLVGLSAVVLCSARTRLVRPAVLVVLAVVLHGGLYGHAFDLVFRNLLLLAAVCDAAWTMVAAVRDPVPEGEEISGTGRSTESLRTPREQDAQQAPG